MKYTILLVAAAASFMRAFCPIKLGGDVGAVGFFVEVIAGCGVGAGPAALAEFPVAADAAFAFELYGVS